MSVSHGAAAAGVASVSSLQVHCHTNVGRAGEDRRVAPAGLSRQSQRPGPPALGPPYDPARQRVDGDAGPRGCDRLAVSRPAQRRPDPRPVPRRRAAPGDGRPRDEALACRPSAALTAAERARPPRSDSASLNQGPGPLGAALSGRYPPRRRPECGGAGAAPLARGSLADSESRSRPVCGALVGASQSPLRHPTAAAAPPPHPASPLPWAIRGVGAGLGRARSAERRETTRGAPAPAAPR